MSSRFDIDDSLLASDTQGWSNLGDWEHHHGYAQAATALAQRVGKAAGVAPWSNALPPADTALLELAIGNGAGLRHWHTACGISRLAGIDIRPACITQAEQALPETIRAHTLLACGSFDTGRLPASIPARAFDHVVCVDAAYHARSAGDFLATARSAMKEGARLGFSTIVLADRQAPSALLGAGMALASIPKGSLLSGADWREALAQQHFHLEHLDDRTQAVFGGFARYISERSKELSARQRASTGWLKIAATARLCNGLSRGHALRYVMMGARLQQAQDRSVRR